MDRLQLVGPLLLFAAVLAAEAAAYALAFAPSSALLWYLNLEVFNLFRKSRIVLSDYCSLPFAQVLVIAGPMALVGALGFFLRSNLCMAISSNLAFVFAAFLGYSWIRWNNSGLITASLAAMYVPSASSLCLYIVLAIASLLSFAISHMLYFGAIRAR